LDLVVQNPIEAVVVLRDFALRFSHPATEGNINAEGHSSLAVSEVLEEVHLLPKERRTVRSSLITWIRLEIPDTST
jgi:hypothetical protein